MNRVKESVASRPATIMAIIFCIAIVVTRMLLVVSGTPINGYDPSKPNNPFSVQGYKENEIVRISGKIETITKKDKVLVEISKVALITQNQATKVTGHRERIQVALNEDYELRIGQYISITGKLQHHSKPTNWGEFDSYSFYSNRGVICKIDDAKILQRSIQYDHIKDRLWRLRLYIESTIEELYDTDDAAILKAMLLGIKNEIPKEVKEAFQKGGISHILAISGLHVSFLCMFIYKCLEILRVKRVLRIITSEILLWLYIIMVGLPASAVRAGIMFSVYALSGLFKRSYDIISSMSIAAILILVLNPWQLFDSAFQLSFLAVIAISVFGRMLINNSRYLSKGLKMQDSSKLSGRLYNILAIKSGYNLLASFSAFIVTLPVLLYSYFEVAAYSVMLNMIILPLMPFLLICGIASIILTEAVGGFGGCFAYMCHWILEIYKQCCIYMEETGLGRRNLGRPHIAQVIIYFAILAFICTYKYKGDLLVKILGIIACICVITVQNNEGVYMLDVGQGDCIVVIDHQSNAYIFDAGSSSRKNIAEDVIFPFLKSKGVNVIGGIFLSHPDEDHINGVNSLICKATNECIRIDGIYLYKESLSNDEYKELEALAIENDVKLSGIACGDVIKSREVLVECIYPYRYWQGESNNNSLVLKVKYGELEMLETGDLEKDGEMEIEDDISADILNP